MWARRDSLGSGLKQPGVYLLAHFETPPTGNANPNSPEVVYIGETHLQTLAERLQSFHRSAFQGSDGHAGGETYRTTYAGDTGKKLFVSVFPPRILISPTLHPTYIQYLESRLRWEFTQTNQRLPTCNKV